MASGDGFAGVGLAFGLAAMLASPASTSQQILAETHQVATRCCDYNGYWIIEQSKWF
jgi:hypothetical protein